MNYTWDLTKIIKDDKEYKSILKEIESLLDEFIKYKGKLLKDENTFYDALEIQKKIDMLSEKIYVYSYLGYYEDMSNKKYQEYKASADSIYEKVESLTSFVNPELLESDYSKIEEYISKNNKLEIYRRSLENLFRFKEHILSAQEEKILSDANEALKTSSNAYDAIDNVDIKFDNIIDEEGKEVELTPYNYSSFLTSKNRDVRKSAFESEYKYYREHINTISALYIGNIKTDSFISKTRKYNSILESFLFDDKIDTKLYKNLIKITNKNLNYLKDYYKIKEEKLGYKLHMYDLYVNTADTPKMKIEYKDAIEIVNEAIKPLGQDYINNFNKLLNSRCVDVFPKNKKRSGAYEWGTYGVDPYVSLNYNCNFDSVSTLAHEMGHAMHSFYSYKNQDYLYASYPIFLAEIASTVNEVLLSNYLINKSDNKTEKIYHLVDFLDKFKATVYRQVMFAEFELSIHEKYEKGESLTKDLLCETYLELNKKHFAPVIDVDSDIQYEWARIPHFYTPFYVYKYATGFISALIIADKLVSEKDFKDKYIKFLSSGSSKYPLDLLGELGIDISDEKVLNRAFELFNEKVNLLKQIERDE